MDVHDRRRRVTSIHAEVVSLVMPCNVAHRVGVTKHDDVRRVDEHLGTIIHQPLDTTTLRTIAHLPNTVEKVLGVLVDLCVSREICIDEIHAHLAGDSDHVRIEGRRIPPDLLDHRGELERLHDSSCHQLRDDHYDSRLPAELRFLSSPPEAM